MSQELAAGTAAPENLVPASLVATAPVGLPAGAQSSLPPSRAFNTRGLSLRSFAARGMLINTAFNIGLSALGLIRGVMLAAFLTKADYGLWAVLGVTLGLLSALKFVGVGDKYIQQDDEDQELAFQHAFTMEVVVTAIVMVPLYLSLPVIAVVYGHWSLVLPGAVLLLALPATALQVPLWTYYRQMEFTRARTLQATDPIVSFVVTLALAIAGAGYWSLVLGLLAGAWSAAIVAVRASPYPLRWRYEKGVVKVYGAYSWPLFVTSVAAIVLANSATVASNVKLGLAGVGVIGLASTITQFTSRVDDIISGTLFPAICAVQDRLDLLLESFVKTNRLALMWAMPFGVGIALFSGDLIHDVLGDRWRPAIGLLQITGVVAAVGHIGFNWDDYFRAEGDTKPIMITQLGTVGAFLVVGVPLTLAFGLTGLAVGITFQALVSLGFRAFFLNRLFQGFAFVRHAARAVIPTLPAAAAALLMRLVESGHRTPVLALAELASYLLITAGATLLMEDRLLSEATGYLVGGRRARPDASS